MSSCRATNAKPPTLAVSQETDVSQQDYPEGTPFEVTAYLESTKERAPIAWAATAAKAAAAATHLENAGLQFVQVRDCRITSAILQPVSQAMATVPEGPKEAPPVAKVCPECKGIGHHEHGIGSACAKCRGFGSVPSGGKEGG